MKKGWYEKLREEWLSDPKVRVEYEALGPQYELAGEFIGARARAGLTQDALAKKMGTSQSAIARIESGKRIPSVRTLQRYAEATNTRLVIKLTPKGKPTTAARRSRRNAG